jgi:hypothetical protein
LGHLPFLLLPSLKTVIIYTVSRHERKVVVVGCSRRWEFKQEMVPTGGLYSKFPSWLWFSSISPSLVNVKIKPINLSFCVHVVVFVHPVLDLGFKRLWVSLRGNGGGKKIENLPVSLIVIPDSGHGKNGSSRSPKSRQDLLLLQVFCSFFLGGLQKARSPPICDLLEGL